MQIVWRGPVHDATGYARQARACLAALIDAGYDVRIEPVNFGTQAVSLEPHLAHAINRALHAELRHPNVLIQHMQPTQFTRDKVGTEYDATVGLTMWETDRLPVEWAEQCNQMDALWVPNAWNQEIFQRSGVTVPVVVVHSPPEVQHYRRPTWRGRWGDLPAETFVFFSNFQFTRRKGADILLKAFWQAFAPDEAVALVLKTYLDDNPYSFGGIIQEIRRLREDLGNPPIPPIYVYGWPLDEPTLIALYNSVDAFVLPSRGEGIGVPYLEAMAVGLPVLGTDWGGNRDFMTDANSYLIPSRLVPVYDPYPWYRADQHWAEPDTEALVELLRQCYRDPITRQAKAQAAQADVIQYTDPQRTVQAFAEAIARLGVFVE